MLCSERILVIRLFSPFPGFRKRCKLLSPALTILLLCLSTRAGDLPKKHGQENRHSQPIPFSHKLHVQLGLLCLNCHGMPEPGDHATYPKEAKCMTCHDTIKAASSEIKKLTEYYRANKPVPWVRIYRIPDYVFFSHKKHHQEAKVDCETCHGPVAEREAIKQEKPTSMTSCMDCHEERGASVGCNYCHNL